MTKTMHVINIIPLHLCSASDIIIDLIVADFWYDKGDPIISDSTYDMWFHHALTLNASNIYFTGVGSAVRGSKIHLPTSMGSLNQIQIGNIEQWISNNSLASENIIITDKMDGTSGLIVYGPDGKPQIAYSRGDGVEGADISRHIFSFPVVPKSIPPSSTETMIRVEVEISNTAFLKLKDMGIKKTDGKPYTTPRNMVAGLMNSETIPESCIPFIQVFAYEIKEFTGTKRLQLDTLLDWKFKVVNYFVVLGNTITDDFLADVIKNQKSNLDFDIDGLVLDVNSNEVRLKLNSDNTNINPKYAIKYKVLDDSNFILSTVEKVVYNISKDRYWKPTVHITPSQLGGVTVSKTTGYNARYILSNNIGPGTVVGVSRMGDVVPNIVSIEKATIGVNPPGDWHWSEEGVDAILDGGIVSEESEIKQISSFFASISAPYLRETSITKLYNEGFTTTPLIISMTSNEMESILGSNGLKAFNGLSKVLSNIELYALIGAFSNHRGIGKRRMKKIVDVFGDDRILELPVVSPVEIAEISTFDKVTATESFLVITEFHHFWEKIQKYVSLKKAPAQVSTILADTKVCFSGFRDNKLKEIVVENGGTMQSKVSSKTGLLVVASKTGKVSSSHKKALNLGIYLLSKEEFIERYVD